MTLMDCYNKLYVSFLVDAVQRSSMKLLMIAEFMMRRTMLATECMEDPGRFSQDEIRSGVFKNEMKLEVQIRMNLFGLQYFVVNIYSLARLIRIYTHWAMGITQLKFDGKNLYLLSFFFQFLFQRLYVRLQGSIIVWYIEQWESLLNFG